MFSKNKIYWNKDKSLGVFFSGRVFDISNIHEYVLEEYKNNETEFVKTLNGVFVLVIYDLKKNKVVICNDRYGMHPFYYSKENFSFSSSVNGILKNKKIKRKIEWDSWRDLFSYGHILGDRTLFKDIFRLPPASILEYSNKKISIKNYWDYGKVKINKKLSEKDFVSLGAEILKRAVLRQSNGIKKMKILLSGGYDSRCIASALKKYTSIKFETFTSPLHGCGRYDIIYAKDLAKKLGVKNKTLKKEKNVYKKYFENFLKEVDYHSFEHLWAVPLRNKIKRGSINMDGIAGDVLLKGPALLFFDKYERETDSKLARDLIYANLRIGPKNMEKYFSKNLAKNLISSKKTIKEELKKIKNEKNKFTEFFIKNRTKNSVSLIPEKLLAKRIETLFLFLDNELVDFALSIPPKMKIDGQIYLKILKKSFPREMKIPSTNDGKKPPMGNIKDYLKVPERNYRIITAFKPREEDFKYLVKRIEKIKMPEFMNRELILEDIHNELKIGFNPCYILVPLLSFLLWYNEFF